MDNFHNYAFILDSPEFAQALLEIMEPKTFTKHSLIHEAGHICTHFYIIQKGIGRVFYYKEDKDITVHFSEEGESITAIDSFVQQKKSKYNIEALEDMEAFAISRTKLELLFKQTPKFERYGRLFLEQIYMDLVERIDDLQLHTAQERYENLLRKKPSLFKRVASKHIASFLSITPETFSRIRANKL